MNFLDLCTTRRSCRGYDSRPIEPEKLDYILQCARLAPSATNRQPWHLYVVTSPEARAAVTSAYDRPWFADAPCYIVVCSEPEAAWTREFDNHNHADIDAAIIAEHITLAATEAGLGSCWVCNFDPKTLRTAINIPQNLQPVAIFPIGYQAPHTPRNTTRKPIDQIVTHI
ncbi:MAG: nitroreductase [Bacteroidales bacterium]|nr:nitroreductase [Bacteroidales bacterium]